LRQSAGRIGTRRKKRVHSEYSRCLDGRESGALLGVLHVLLQPLLDLLPGLRGQPPAVAAIHELEVVRKIATVVIVQPFLVPLILLFSSLAQQLCVIMGGTERSEAQYRKVRVRNGV